MMVLNYKLEDDITAEFMKDLLKWFKEQKTLHKVLL